MPNGTVKKVVNDRGFGFIAAEDGKEYFFHRSGLDSSLNFDSLNGGEAVTFEVEASQKGPRATRGRAASPPSTRSYGKAPAGTYPPGPCFTSAAMAVPLLVYSDYV